MNVSEMNEAERSIDRRVKALGIDVKNTRKSAEKLHNVKISDDQFSDAYHWCNEHLGDRWIWARWLNEDNINIYFESSEYAILFALKFQTSPK